VSARINTSHLHTSPLPSFCSTLQLIGPKTGTHSSLPGGSMKLIIGCYDVWVEG
jgi:hypothetical protein